MNRNPLGRGLTWCVVVILLVPALIAVVLGLGALLAALGDAPAAAICGRVALGLGVVLVVAVVATTALNALVLLAPRPRRRHKSRRRRRPVDLESPGRTVGPA